MTHTTGNGDVDVKMEAIARVAEKLTLYDIRMRRLTTEAHQVSSEPPFHLTLIVSPTVAVADGVAIYEVRYEVEAKDQRDVLIFVADVTLNVFYGLPKQDEFDEADLESFGQTSVVQATQPYLREILHSTTLRMGLPPLVVDVIRSPQIIHRETDETASQGD